MCVWVAFAKYPNANLPSAHAKKEIEMQKLGFIGLPMLAMITALLMTSALGSEAPQSENMLYLVEFEANEAGVPTIRQQAIELLEQMIVPSLDNLAKDSNIHAGGLDVGARAGGIGR